MKVAKSLGRQRIGCCRTSTAMCPTSGPNPEDVRPSRLWGDSRLSPKSVNERQTLSCLSYSPALGPPSEEMRLSGCIDTPQASSIPEIHRRLQASVTASNTCKAAILGRDEDAERQKRVKQLVQITHSRAGDASILPFLPT